MKLSLYLGLLLFALPAYAGPADPPTLPALPDPQMVGISRFSVADIAELPTPGNPPTGILRLYADSGSGQLKCLTPTGTSCLSSGGGGTPGGSPTQLQFNNTTFGGATFNYNAAGSCQEITITCDNISNDGSVPGSGFVVDAGGSASEFNFISAATAPAASGGGMLKVYTASSNGVAKNVGPEAVAGFFRASVATVGAQAVAIQGKAATFATDATDGQSLDAVTAAIALNNTRVGSLVADATAIYLTAPLCDFGGCVTVQKATNLYGLKIGDQAGFSTTEQAAIKILSQTAGSGTTFSIKCDIGCGVASFGNGVAFPGSSSGTATVVAQAAASTPTLTLPTGTGTFAVTASSPLVLDATTGALTCATCLTATTPTNHGVLLGAGTQAVGATAAPATANEPLVSGASADPTFLPYAIPATIAAHQTLVATSTTVVAAKTIPDCTDTTGNHLNYTQSSDAYSCGTSNITQNTPAVVGKSITAYNSTTGAFTQSNGMCAPQFSSTDTLTAAATSPTETVFATQCSIAANTIIAGTVIRGVVGIDWTATATVPNFTFRVKLCAVSGCASGTVINIYTSATTAPSAGTFSTSLPILIQGTAAAGATATIAQAINSGTGANAPAGRNAVAGLVANVPTNGTLFLQFSVAFSTNAATNSVTITSLTFAP